MKKIFGLLVLSSFLLTSCKKDEVNTDNEIIENKILSFSSNTAMQLKIDEIKLLESQKEYSIQQQIVTRNKLRNPTSTDFELYRKNKFTNLDKSQLIKDLEFYHKEKLRVIYELRNELKFTSIQSIADEINSLKLLNPNQSDALFNHFSSMLEKTEFCTSPIFDKEEAYVINTSGEIEINGQKLFLVKNNQANGLPLIYQGILVTNGIYAITYAAGVNANIFGNNTQKFTQFASFVNLGSGYFAYPSWFYRAFDANAAFTSDPAIDVLAFFSGYGPSTTNNASSNFATTWRPLLSEPPYTSYYSKAAGNFVAILGGQYVIITGSKIIY